MTNISNFSTVSLLVMILLVFGSCENPDLPQSNKEEKITFCIEDYRLLGEDATKTSIVNSKEFIWSANDTVGIYPNTGSQVYFAMTQGAGAKSAEFDGGGWDFKPSAVYYSYYPFIGNIYLNRNRIPVSYSGQKQTGTTGTDHIGPYDYMYTPPTSSLNAKLNFSYKHLSCIIRPKLTLPAGTYTKLAITAPSESFATDGYFDLEAISPAIVPEHHTKQITIDLENIVLAQQTTFYVYILAAPVDLKGTQITVSVLNSEKKELQCKKTPSYVYDAGTISGLACSEWTEVPQSMGLIIEDWGYGGQYTGGAE